MLGTLFPSLASLALEGKAPPPLQLGAQSYVQLLPLLQRLHTELLVPRLDVKLQPQRVSLNLFRLLWTVVDQTAGCLGFEQLCSVIRVKWSPRS